MISRVERWTRSRTGLGDALEPAALERWQLGRVRELAARIRAQSRFYCSRLAGLDPRRLRTAEDLARLPFTSPADLAADPGAFLCVPAGAVARLTTLVTSGTTGGRKRLGFTAGDLARTVDFFDHGMRDLVRPGQTVLVLLSGGTENSVARLLEAGLAPRRVAVGIADAGWDPERAVTAVRGAQFVVGMPAQLLYLCRIAPELRPEGVLLSADYVPRSLVAALEAAWGCRVFSHYGLTETGYGCAVQCPARTGHHLRHPDVLVEIVDPVSGARLPPGEQGEIVLTTLRAEAMPLLRYRTGDLGRLLVDPCACGGILPRLGRVEGRIADPGALPSIHQLDEALFALPGVRGFRAERTLREGRPRLAVTVEAGPELEWDVARGLLPTDWPVDLRPGPACPLGSQAKRRIGSSVAAVEGELP